jgi:hypothetical protein
MFVIFPQAVKTKAGILFLKSKSLVLYLSTKIVDYYISDMTQMHNLVFSITATVNISCCCVEL